MTIDAFEIELDGGRALVIASSLTPASEAGVGAQLTRAERTVVELAMQGMSNALIAETRGTSERTVANQMASIFRKLRVASRAELASRVGDGDALGPR